MSAIHLCMRTRCTDASFKQCYLLCYLYLLRGFTDSVCPGNSITVEFKKLSTMVYASLPGVPPSNLSLTRLCRFATPSFPTLFNNFLRLGSSSSIHSGIFRLYPACLKVASAAWSESSGSCNESTVPVVSISVDAR